MNIRHIHQCNITEMWACSKRKYNLAEGSSTAEKSVRDFEFDFKISQISGDSAKILRFQQISDFSEDVGFQRRFQISRGFLQRFQDFRTHFRFQQRFHGSQRTAYIAKARSVVPVPVRPSATQRVRECVYA